MNKLTKHIKVSPPYYALKNLQLLKSNGAYVSAEIPVEYPAGRECGSITAAEIGRHLAILGSCSLSQSNPIKEKHYYTANKATLNCLCKEKVISKNSEFIGEAKTLSINKKKGIALSILKTQNNIPVFELTTEYQIIKEPIFDRLFISKKITNNLSSIKLSSNPYTKEFPLTNIKYDNKNLSLTTKFDNLKQSDCIGHFDNYPIIPVSIMMHALSKAASKMLSKIVQVYNPAYFIHFATMEAKKLAFAEDIVNIFVNYFGKFNDLYIFKCSAKNELNEKYGSLLLAMESL